MTTKTYDQLRNKVKRFDWDWDESDYIFYCNGKEIGYNQLQSLLIANKAYLKFVCPSLEVDVFDTYSAITYMVLKVKKFPDLKLRFRFSVFSESFTIRIERRNYE